MRNLPEKAVFRPDFLPGLRYVGECILLSGQSIRPNGKLLLHGQKMITFFDNNDYFGVN